jgi:hypothetical protein
MNVLLPEKVVRLRANHLIGNFARCLFGLPSYEQGVEIGAAMPEFGAPSAKTRFARLLGGRASRSARTTRFALLPGRDEKRDCIQIVGGSG